MSAHIVPKTIDEIPGWFAWTDQRVFEHFLSDGSVQPNGDLVELGAYLGKSAALIGKFRRVGEKFTVCDLFGAATNDEANAAENRLFYPTLDLEAFQRNYSAITSELPDIVQDTTSAITSHVNAGSARFVHVDASHLYEHVVVDAESAKVLLLPDGLAVFDDYRSIHTPGVSAAVWEAVFNKGLVPVCLTPNKFYGTYGNAGEHQKKLIEWLQDFGRLHYENQLIAEHDVIRIWADPPPNSLASEDQEQNFATQRSLRKTRKRLASLESRVAILEAELTQGDSFVQRTAGRVRQKVRRLRNA